MITPKASKANNHSRNGIGLGSICATSKIVFTLYIAVEYEVVMMTSQ